MANQKRQPAKAQPISAHPLFPAVVALWFGALFGLGSLAVRPSLLENLVLQSHIDLVIPAAAPPLGITARILLALMMAALGAVLGILLSRRLTRPRPELHERKRGAMDLAVSQPRVRARDAHPDAPARRPISAHEELGGEAALASVQTPATGPGMLATRRRALALIEDEPEFVPHELAPLPGRAAIQPLDLASLALPENSPLSVTAAPLESPPPGAATPLDWSQTAPPAAGPWPAAPVLLSSLGAATIQPLPAEAAHRDGRQVFGMAQPAPPAQAPRQIFGVVAEDDHLPQDFVKAAGFQTSVFDTPAANALFVRPEPVSAPEAAAESSAPAPEPRASPASLGMTDLAARLAESMRRRRERTVTAVADLVTEPAAAPVLAQVTAAASAMAQPDVPAPLAMPAAMRPLALDAFLADDDAFDPGLLLPRHIVMPAAKPASAVFAVPVASVMPQPSDDLAADEPVEDEQLAAESDDNSYASLLGLAPPRPAFVRIEEPATDMYDAPEPVVIFPGQAPHIAPVLTATPAAEEDNAFRRFDAPSSAGQGQPVAATSAATTIDPAEAEQALRAALNNLQRMSGAA